MPPVPMLRPVDSIDRAPYKIGYSFKNPKVVAMLTHVRDRKFFETNWAAEGPTQKKERMYQSGQLNRYSSVWRRAAKGRTAYGLGEVVTELPSFNELGEAPGPTDKQTPAAPERSWWGSLANTLTTAAATVLTEQQKLQTAKAQAAAQQQGGMQFIPSTFYPQDQGIGVLGWGLIIGGVGLGAYYYMKK